MSKHTLCVLVENKPGALSRITALFSRRGYNIDSVSEASTHLPGVSRLTLVVSGSRSWIDQVAKQIRKLVPVLSVVAFEGDRVLSRELMLVKVEAGPQERSAVLERVRGFGARTLDHSPGALTLEASGTPEHLDALLDELAGYRIAELVRSGAIALGRGPRLACPAPRTPAPPEPALQGRAA